MKNMPQIYIISGPPGIGKSTISEKLALRFENSALIEGDLIYLMVKGGIVAPWENDQKSFDLFWDNIIDITNNFIEREMTVVLEYVLFPEHIKKYVEHFRVNGIDVKYSVLLAEESIIIERDNNREDYQKTGELSIKSLREFKEKNIDEKFIIDTSYMEIEEIVEEIINNDRFLV